MTFLHAQSSAPVTVTVHPAEGATFTAHRSPLPCYPATCAIHKESAYVPSIAGGTGHIVHDLKSVVVCQLHNDVAETARMSDL
eukprot:353017-Chlamydomonas_euryale.AAC.9